MTTDIKPDMVSCCVDPVFYSSSDSNVLVLPEESMDDLLSSVDLSFLNDCPELEQWFMELIADGDLSQW